MRLVLASSSPRRIGFLSELGLSFTAIAPDVDETIPAGTDPVTAVSDLAVAKARAVAGFHADALVIAADTIVVRDGEILGKPADAEHAHRMLTALQGRVHQVFTGVALIGPSDMQVIDVTRTDVRMRALDDKAISAYIATGEPMDKAGAYGIQAFGAALIAEIDGCFSSVAGLPICRVTDLLGSVGIWTAPVVPCGVPPDRAPDSIAQRFPLQ